MRRGNLIPYLTLIGWVLLFVVSLDHGTHEPAIGLDEAARLVHAHFPTAQVVEMRLSLVDGKPIYEVELVMPQGQKKDLRVNARSGQIEELDQDLQAHVHA